MASLETTQTLFLGLTIKDVVISLIVPVAVAVLTVLFLQESVQRKERRTQILRMLMASRHIPADAAFNAAINLIPVEFNKDKAVIEAWSAYIHQARYQPSPGDENTHINQMTAKQTKLIAAIMRKLGMTFSEADLQVDAYISKGFVQRDNLYLDSLAATRDAATAMRDVADALKFQAGLLYQQLNPPPQDPGDR